MNPAAELTLLLSTCLLGMGIGSLVRGLWRAQAAERAQTGAWGTSRRLRRGLSRPPRTYRRRASIWFSFLASGAIAACMTAWYFNQAFPVPDLAQGIAMGFWFCIGTMVFLFPLGLGLPLVLAGGLIGASGLAYRAGHPGLASGTVHWTGPGVHIPVIYRPLLPQALPLPPPSGPFPLDAAVTVLRVLPGLVWEAQ